MFSIYTCKISVWKELEGILEGAEAVDKSKIMTSPQAGREVFRPMQCQWTSYPLTLRVRR